MKFSADTFNRAKELANSYPHAAVLLAGVATCGLVSVLLTRLNKKSKQDSRDDNYLFATLGSANNEQQLALPPKTLLNLQATDADKLATQVQKLFTKNPELVPLLQANAELWDRFAKAAETVLKVNDRRLQITDDGQAIDLLRDTSNAAKEVGQVMSAYYKGNKQIADILDKNAASVNQIGEILDGIAKAADRKANIVTNASAIRHNM